MSRKLCDFVAYLTAGHSARKLTQERGFDQPVMPCRLAIGTHASLNQCFCLGAGRAGKSLPMQPRPLAAHDDTAAEAPSYIMIARWLRGAQCTFSIFW